MTVTSVPAPELPEVASWCRRRGLRLCVVFGSRARGGARPESDLDLALWADPQPAAGELLAWRRELSEAAGLPVQAVLVTPRLDPVLGFQIVGEGRPLHESHPGTWAREQLRLWHAYQDALPFLRAARRQLRRFAAETRVGT
jgi:predicted nucleotidyltransferase